MTKDTPEYVLIIGAARSGTKFVRDLLGTSTACHRVPYDVGYVWQTGHEAIPHNARDASDCTPWIRQYIDKSLRRLSGWRASCGAPYIVEKSVSNCLCIPFVEEVLPGPRYIHLLRDGRDVVESSYRMWNESVSWKYLLRKLPYVPWRNWRHLVWYAKNLFEGRSAGWGKGRIWGVRYPGIEDELQRTTVLEVCARQWAVCVATAMKDLAVIPEERKLEIRYEDLISNGQRQLKRICEFLELPDGTTVEAYHKRTLRPGRTGAWKGKFDAESWAAAMNIMRRPLETLGYLDQPSN